MVALPRPFELSAGEPFADVASTVPVEPRRACVRGLSAAGGALSRDPALALAPLRFLRGHRFAPPRWPPDAAPTLITALDKAEACARASPSPRTSSGTQPRPFSRRGRAGDRRTVPRSRPTSSRPSRASSPSFATARSTPTGSARNITPRNPAPMSSPRGIPRPNSPHSHPSSDRTPALVLACVAAAPPCDDQLRLEALHALVRPRRRRRARDRVDGLVLLVVHRERSSAGARRRATLAAALVYALSAAEALDAHAGVDGVEARARDASRAFAMTCRATSPSDALFAQRVGATLIAGCKTLHPRRYYPRGVRGGGGGAGRVGIVGGRRVGGRRGIRVRRGRDGGGGGGRGPRRRGRDANRRRNDDSNHRGRIPRGSRRARLERCRRRE